MRCCVDFCRNTSDNVSPSAAISRGKHEGVSFHRFPSEVHLRAAWRRALGKQDAHLPDAAVVCSKHFLHDDICEAENGSRQLRTGAVPSTVLVCMICLDIDSKMLLMRKYDLREAYEKLTGRSLCDRATNLKQTLCVQCAQRLRNFSRFRDKSLRARSVMMDLIEKNKLITIQHIKMIDRVKFQLNGNFVSTTIGPDHWDLYVQENYDVNTPIDLEETVQKVEADSLWVTEDMKVDCMPDDNLKLESELDDAAFSKRAESNSSVDQERDFVQDPLKCESLWEPAYSAQDNGSDGECKPLMAASSDQDSSHITASQNKVSPLSMRHATRNAVKKRATVSAGTRRRIKLKTANKRARKTKSVSKNSNNSSCTEERFLICDTCQRKFKTKGSIISHLETHTEKKPFSCMLCKFESKYKKSLQVHMQNHAGERPYPCPLCDYRGSTKSSVNCHLRIHTGEKPFPCDICDYRCGSRARLLAHMATHTGEKPFLCEFCDFKSVIKYKLKIHMRKHTGVMNFACKLSEYKSNRGAVQKVQAVEKSYACKQCEFIADSKHNLVAHVKTQHKDKPFACLHCEYKCAEKFDFERHMRVHSR